MPIEKGIVFLRNFGLEFDEDEDLIYIEDARYHLSCHQWEVDIVTVSHDFVYGHIYVQTHLEALVKHCQNYLQAHIDQDYDKDHLSLTMEQFEGIVGAFTLEFAHTATVAQTVVHFSDFVDHGLENDGMKIVLHFFGELLPMLVHLVTNLAATGHKFICSRLVVRIPHYLLGTSHDPSHESQTICRRLDLKHEYEAILDEQVEVGLPVFEIDEHGHQDDELHYEIANGISLRPKWNENEWQNVEKEAHDQCHAPFKQWNLS